MEIIRGFANLQPRHRGAVVTIGNFDGVHCGHQAILSRVRDKARQLDKPSMIICFEPQPREYFDPDNAPPRLTRFREKVTQLSRCGVDLILCSQFNRRTQSMPAEQFVALLGEQIETSALFVGDDFRFGADRSGDFDMLRRAGEQYGFEVTNMTTLVMKDERVSSTRIREALQAGKFEDAETLLGRPYAITGNVVYGRQLGRELGAPTANIQLHRYRAPIDGIYAVEVEGLGARRQGVANVGVRPTLNEVGVEPLLEVHLFDFEGDIYGKTVDVIFRRKIREEVKFDSVESLKMQIAKDIEDARAFFDRAQLAANH